MIILWRLNRIDKIKIDKGLKITNITLGVVPMVEVVVDRIK